jgi:hypothetical protein
MPFMPDDDVSGNVLGGVTGSSDMELYKTKDPRSDAERRVEEQKRRAQEVVLEDDGNTYRTEKY